MLNSLKSRASCCDGRAEQNMRIAWSSRSKDGLGSFGVDHGNVQVWCNLVEGEGFKLVKENVRLLLPMGAAISGVFLRTVLRGIYYWP